MKESLMAIVNQFHYRHCSLMMRLLSRAAYSVLIVIFHCEKIQEKVLHRIERGQLEQRACGLHLFFDKSVSFEM